MYIQTVHSCRHRLSTHMVQTKQQLQTRSIPVYTEHSYGKQLYTYIKQINKYYTAKDQVHQGLGTIQSKQNTATDKDQVHTQYIQTSRTQLQARTYTHMIQTYRTQLQTRTKYTYSTQTNRTQLQGLGMHMVQKNKQNTARDKDMAHMWYRPTNRKQLQRSGTCISQTNSTASDKDLVHMWHR